MTIKNILLLATCIMMGSWACIYTAHTTPRIPWHKRVLNVFGNTRNKNTRPKHTLANKKKRIRRPHNKPVHTNAQRAQPPQIIPETLALQLSRKALEYTNKFRAKKGLSILVWNQDLADQARNHAVNMGMAQVSFGHDGFKQRVHNLPKKAWAASENVFMCHNMHGDLAQIAVDGWIKSPGHLRNIIGNYSHCGIGAYQNAQGTWYFVQFFAKF